VTARRDDIADLHQRYAAEATTPVTATAAAFAMIEAENPRLKAWIDLDHAGGAAAAQASLQRLGTGNGRPLEGITVGVKANIAVQGLGWNAGMALFRDRAAPRDASVVQALREAGAIVLGTLNMHEAALGATSDNPWFGRCANPHDPDRTPGGSSGGSGAAVAAGHCVIALGTDTLGSVRIPAAYCGVYGFKPTNGLVDPDGLAPLHEGFDSIGLLARSLDDIGRVLPIVAPMLMPSPTPLRAFTLADNAGVALEPAVAAGLQRALEVAGPILAPAVTPPHPLWQVRLAGLVESILALVRSLGGAEHIKDPGLSPDLQSLLAYGLSRDASKRAEDRAVLAETVAWLRDIIASDGALITATAPQVAFGKGTGPPVTQADFTALANIAGLPAVSLPAGVDEDAYWRAVDRAGWRRPWFAGPGGCL
jgi:aspartyl-tRNA(Asn)/glutamyl-tRNA(Gln) amidotransferase subunit A